MKFAKSIAGLLRTREAVFAEAERQREALSARGDQVVWLRGSVDSSPYHFSQFCAGMTRRDGVSRYVPMFEEEATERGRSTCRRCRLVQSSRAA